MLRPEARWLTEFVDAFPLLFITDQRLVVEEEPEPRQARRVSTSRTAAEVAAIHIVVEDLRRPDRVRAGVATSGS